MTKVTPKKKGKSLFDEKLEPKGDWAALIESVKANPALYAGIVVFIVVCFISGLAYRGYTQAAEKELLTKYAKALEEYEPMKLMQALEPIAYQRGKIGAEIMYMYGETAYRAQQYDKAKAAFEKLRTDYADSPNVPDAVEGLGYIAEQKGDFDAALGFYKEVSTKWKDSFTARRQSLNIGRVTEAKGDLKGAMDAYRQELQEFAGSHVASDAQSAIDRLGSAHPELAPAAPAPVASTAPAPAEVATPASQEAVPDTPKLNLTLPNSVKAPATTKPSTPAPAPESEAPANTNKAPEPVPAPPAAK